MKSFTYSFLIGCYKIFPFKKSLCLLLKFLNVPNDKFYKDLKFKGEIKVPINNNGSFKMMNYGGSIANETFWKGLFVTFENETGWAWKELCKFSDIIFDVGANVGIYSLVAKTINPQSKIYAFEPSQNTFYKLQKNITLNDFDIECSQLALSNTNGNLTFYDVPNEHQTSASLSPDKLKNLSWYHGEVKEYDVEAVSIEHFIKSKNISKLDLIKIDVELHEPEIIEGFGKYLKEYNPIVFIEVLTEEIANKLNNLIPLDDYHLYHLKEEGVVVPQNKFSVHPCLWNYVVFHKSKKQFIDSNTTIFQN